jgi:hypothetical protein
MRFLHSILAAGPDIVLLAGVSGIIVLALLTYPYRVEFKRRRRAAARARDHKRREQESAAPSHQPGSPAA